MIYIIRKKNIRKKYIIHYFLITENGISDRAGNLDDFHRVFYYKHYINNVLLAMTEDGCNVKG